VEFVLTLQETIKIISLLKLIPQLHITRAMGKILYCKLNIFSYVFSNMQVAGDKIERLRDPNAHLNEEER